MKVAVVISDADKLDPKLLKLVTESISGILNSIEQNVHKVKKQYCEGTLSQSTGFDWFVDQNAKGGDL